MQHLKGPAIWLLRLVVAGLAIELLSPHLAGGETQLMRAAIAFATLAMLGAIHASPAPAPETLDATPELAIEELPQPDYIAPFQPVHYKKPVRYQFQAALETRVAREVEAARLSHRGRRTAAIGYLVLAILLAGLIADPSFGRQPLETGLADNLGRAVAGLSDVVTALFGRDWRAAQAWLERELLLLADGDMRALWQLIPMLTVVTMVPALALTALTGTGRARRRRTSPFGEPLAWR
ncbi:hypothetical protein [Pseudoroseicyclus tamaricis]|uniref:Uncharacterized protein n=1 Tax=Pseudoroseicyclus tamaricis TaxID=2705421 RepID=A0A6B2JKN0_9RHOB|nr:hypothetical protein [Pseudoroseicyclus tamaricis]NDV02053.1 hypothetical protein [Pseudoroseicyclus tamaricis]